MCVKYFNIGVLLILVLSQSYGESRNILKNRNGSYSKGASLRSTDEINKTKSGDCNTYIANTVHHEKNKDIGMQRRCLLAGQLPSSKPNRRPNKLKKRPRRPCKLNSDSACIQPEEDKTEYEKSTTTYSKDASTPEEQTESERDKSKRCKSKRRKPKSRKSKRCKSKHCKSKRCKSKRKRKNIHITNKAINDNNIQINRKKLSAINSNNGQYL